MQTYSSYNMWLGLAVALLSSFLIGGSVILKKKLTGDHLSCERVCVCDVSVVGTGEVCNFAAYMFAPATLVTPLGALSVLISAVLSSHLLGEQLNVVGKFGCLLCVLGSILLVIHAPQEREVTSIQDMTNKLLEPGFLVYVVALLVLCAVLVLYFCPRSGRSNILIYIGICSLLGAFTISSVKGLAIAINTGEMSQMAACFFLLNILKVKNIFITQVSWSLDTFNTLLVYPIYYVLFTSVVLSTSIILFQEWSSMSAVDVVTTLGSFLVIVVGVALLHLFRELQVGILSPLMSLLR
uniref:Uncharacterized protein n=1 Tax=Xiphophorus couchianus TaxID=32473 RepID=A0A3B5LDH3_9TELE